MRTIVLSSIALLMGVIGAQAVELRKAQTLDAPVCGGFPGYICKETHWCDYPDQIACGAGDFFGTCRTRPEACTEEFNPVCACDGKTYGNACQAAAAGYDVAHAGKCG